MLSLFALPISMISNKLQKISRTFLPEYTSLRYKIMFLKIQQPNKISILEDAELVRDSVRTISEFAASKLDVFFSRAI